MDWEQHKYGAGVECTFTPRENFDGRAMRPGMADHAGKTVRLIALWLMGDDDPYPGEWALGATDRRSEVFGRMWIASGDVTPNVNVTGAQHLDPPESDPFWGKDGLGTALSDLAVF